MQALRIIAVLSLVCLVNIASAQVDVVTQTIDGKPHYVDLIPRVWQHLQHNLRHPALAAVADSIAGVLPPPTPEFLEHLKSQCATIPTPS